MKENPVGVFDSGIGGLSVIEEILKVLPGENIIYFGDTARVPYGTKSEKVVKRFSIEDVKFLLKFNPKVIIIACHTASSLAGDFLKNQFPHIHFIDVVRPSVDKAVKLTVNKKIGVIGTSATVSSGKYTELIKEKDKEIKVFSQACPLFVPLVEEGLTSHRISYEIAEYYLKNLKEKNIDTLILGCTHYPYLKSVISDVFEGNVNIVDASYEVAVELKNFLQKKEDVRYKNDGTLSLFFSDISPYTENAIKILLKEKKFKLEKVEVKF